MGHGALPGSPRALPRLQEPMFPGPAWPAGCGAEAWLSPRPRVCLQGLSLVLSEGSLRDGEEKEPPAEEDLGDAETLQGYQWLLRDLPRLPLFDSVRATTALALQQVRASRGPGAGRDCRGARSHRLPSGHPHGDRPTDRQRLPGVPVPAHACGGAGPAQRLGAGEAAPRVGGSRPPASFLVAFRPERGRARCCLGPD